jgi:hypothetical protein
MLKSLLAGLIVVTSLADSAAADRAKANVSCTPTGQALQYDCVIKLTNARTSEPLSGVTLMVGADMPSMPMMHNVRPVRATAEQPAGTYRARLLLEMHGDWAVQLNLSGPLRDRVVSMLRFEPQGATPVAAAPRPQKGHKP